MQSLESSRKKVWVYKGLFKAYVGIQRLCKAHVGETANAKCPMIFRSSAYQAAHTSLEASCCWVVSNDF